MHGADKRANHSGSSRRGRQLRSAAHHKVAEHLRVPARLASLDICHGRSPPLLQTSRPLLYFNLFNRFNSPSDQGVPGRVQRCWLARRWSLCACSRPNRSIFGLSCCNSSRRTTPDKGLLSSMMWVDRLSYSYITMKSGLFIIAVSYLLPYELQKSKYMHQIIKGGKIYDWLIAQFIVYSCNYDSCLFLSRKF